MPDDMQKSRTGKTSDRQNEEVELDEEMDIDIEELDEDVSDEDRGIVSDDESDVAEREAELGNRVTRDDGDNDDEGELK